MIKKLNKKVILSVLLFIILFSNIIPISKAAMLSGEINIFSQGNNKLLMYNNKALTVIKNVYRNEGEPYPAYNALYPTYNYNNVYNEELIEENDFLWQVVANGYPYKSISDLKCESYDEAYIATQAAIYCAHCGHVETDYSYIEGNEASIRTYNAFLEILKNARTNPITINKNNVLKLIKEQNEWQLDNENQEYVYRTYHIQTNYEVKNYSVDIENFDDAIIEDRKFNYEESFKIKLPITSLNKSGELKINITTDIETMPIYLGSSSKNAYVLTGPRYEEKIDSFSESYQENLTSINIEITELDTKIGIENALVNLLDENRELISTFTTNEQGKIFIEHLIPGTYYIEQTATEDGYNTYAKQVELKMDYNKMLNLSINNAPINIENITNKEENITITEEIIEKNITNEKTDINITNKTEIVNVDNTNNEYTETNNKLENNINNETNKDAVNNTENTTNKNNVSNVNNTTNTTNKNNENNTENENNVTNIVNESNLTNSTNKNNVTNTTNKNNTNNTSNTTGTNNTNNSNTSNIVTNTKYYGTSTSKNTSVENVKTLPKTGM